jgi:AraC family transcriptional regulator, arabinose operon regulatory protein
VTELLQQFAGDFSVAEPGSPTRRRDGAIKHSSSGLAVRSGDRRVQLILMLLEENSERQWELSDIARIVNLSPGRLAHLFKNEVGVSIQQYLTQIRLAKAKHQLESSFLSIKEIAASVGFRNVTRFTSSFKTAVGTTPAEYRRLSAMVNTRRKDLAIARSANR